MVDKGTPSISALPGSRGRIWLLGAALVLLAGGAAFLWGRTGQPERPGEAPLEGELIVAVRPTAGARDTLALEEPGAVPVRAGGSMHLGVRFNQPAFAYLVWLDCQGRAVPLYPWNYDGLDVTDVNEPPPVRRPAKVVFSPTIGTGWPFGKRGGLETVLLLARRTPLDEDTRLGTLLGPPPPAPMRRRDEVAVLGLGRDAGGVATLLALNRGTEEEARQVDQPLRALLDRLRDHFELIRVARFAHEGE